MENNQGVKEEFRKDSLKKYTAQLIAVAKAVYQAFNQILTEGGL